MKLFIRVFTIGAVILAAFVTLYSPSFARALVNPNYTPPYWTR